MRQHGLSSRSPRYRLGSPMSSTVSLTCRRPVCTSFSPGTGRPTGNRTSPHSSRPPPNAYPRPARTRMRRQGCCRSVKWLPGFLPAITQGLSSSRGRDSRSRTAEGASDTDRPPVLVSGSRSSPVSRSTCSQGSFWISKKRHPVSKRRRIAATTESDSEPSRRASSRTCPSRANSSALRNRSRLSSL